MGRMGAWLKAKSPRLHRVLTTRDRPWPLLREIIAGALVIVLLVGGLYGLTGQPLKGGYPVVVVTTGSMMHCTNAGEPAAALGSGCDPTSWGRLGSIDPGDLVFVRAVDEASDVTTLAEADGSHYGRQGDVIVYRPHGDTGRTPIIHRALFWVQANSDGTYTVPGLGLDHVRRLDSPAIRQLTGCDLTDRFDSARHARADASGFVTRGDNNPGADACQNDPGIAHLEWILGKARGEVPWIGLVNLLWGDITTGSRNYANAGGDSKVMFFVSVAVLVSLPWIIEFGVRRRRRRRQERDEEDEA